MTVRILVVAGRIKLVTKGQAVPAEACRDAIQEWWSNRLVQLQTLITNHVPNWFEAGMIFTSPPVIV